MPASQSTESTFVRILGRPGNFEVCPMFVRIVGGLTTELCPNFVRTLNSIKEYHSLWPSADDKVRAKFGQSSECSTRPNGLVNRCLAAFGHELGSVRSLVFFLGAIAYRLLVGARSHAGY